MHVAQSLALLTWGSVVDQLICEVDVALDEVHVFDELFELVGNFCGQITTFRVRVRVGWRTARLRCGGLRRLAC